MHFPYTPAGVAAAKKYSKMMNKTMVMDPDKMTEKVDNPKEDMMDKLRAKKSKKKKK